MYNLNVDYFKNIDTEDKAYWLGFLYADGCVPAKSLILRFPSKDIVPDYLIRHFIRGYFDGDGCYSAIMRKCANKPNPIFMGEIKFLGTYDMMEHISQELPCDNVDVSKDGAIYKIRYHKKELLKAILSYMYDDSVIYLDRKYQKYLDNKDNLIDKRKVKNNIPVTTTVV